MSQAPGTPRIRFNPIIVIPAVDLEDQLPGYAGEIGEERTDRMLAAVFAALYPMRANELPEDLLRPAALLAKLACAFDFLFIPLSPPLPLAGRGA